MLEITAEEFNKFSNLNDKVRKVEVRAKDYLLQLEPLLQKQKNEGLIDDFEIEPRADFEALTLNLALNPPFCQTAVPVAQLKYTNKFV